MQTRRLVAASAALACLSGAALADFNFTDFSDPSALTLNSSVENYTYVSNNTLYLSDGTQSGSGSAFYTAAQNLAGAWSTTFTYTISDGTPPDDFTTGADGISLVVTKNGPTSLGGGGGNIGLNGGFGGAAVMFRTWDNQRIDLAASNVNLDPFSDEPKLDSIPITDNLLRGEHTVLITYTPPNPARGDVGGMAAYLDGVLAVHADLDLQNYMGESLLNDDGTAWIGLTAGTGLGIDVQQINSWSFVPTPGAAGVFGLAGLAAARRRR